MSENQSFRYSERLIARTSDRLIPVQKGLFMLLWGLFTLGYIIGAMFSASIFSNRKEQE